MTLDARHTGGLAERAPRLVSLVCPGAVAAHGDGLLRMPHLQRVVLAGLKLHQHPPARSALEHLQLSIALHTTGG